MPTLQASETSEDTVAELAPVPPRRPRAPRPEVGGSLIAQQPQVSVNVEVNNESETDETIAEDSELEPVMAQAAVAPPREPRRAAQRAPGGGGNPVLERLKTAADLEVRDWLDQIAAETPMQVSLIRKEPKSFIDPDTGESKKTDGTVETYDRQIEEKEIQEKHGGGTYQLFVRTKNNVGQWKYFAARTINIAGDPKLNDVPRTVPKKDNGPQYTIPAPDPMAGKMVDRAFEFMARQVDHAQTARPSGPSMQDMSVMMRPMELQIQGLQAMLQQKDREIAVIRTTPPEKDEFRDKLLNNLMDGESARIAALRAQYDSEIRQLKEGFAQTEIRIRDQAQRDQDRVDRSHERELANIKAANDAAILAATSSANIQKTVLEGDNRRLEREVAELRVEVKELRAKRDPSLKDKLAEMKDLKELVNGDDDGEDESTFSKVVGAIGNMPILTKMADRFAGGAPATAQQPQPQQRIQMQPAAQRPPRLARSRSTGQVFAQTGRGIVPVTRKPQQTVAADGTPVEIPEVDRALVKEALTFMENAYRSGTEAKVFADSARPMVPTAMLTAIRQLGIDGFLVQIGGIDNTSPFATQSGRNWVRRVARALLGDVDSAQAGEAPPP